MKYAIGHDGFRNGEYGVFDEKRNAEDVLKRCICEEQDRHARHPDWSWVNYHLMYSKDGEHWSLSPEG